MHKIKRNPNIFEKFLLIIGVFVIIVGYGFITNAQNVDSVSYWAMLQTIFLWLILTVMIILLAVNENMKEELRVIQEEQLEQVKLLNKSEKKELHYEFDELKELKNMKKH